MAKQANKNTSGKQSPATAKKGWVKKENVWLIAFVCLVAGFVGGVTFGVYRSGNMPAVAHPEAEGRMPPTAAGMGAVDDDKRRMISELENHLEHEPRDLTALTQLAHLYFDANQLDKAIKAYQQVLELDKDNPDIWTDLGIMYRRSQRPEDAIAAFKQAASLDPRHVNSRYNTGVVLLHDLKDTPGALKAWEELLAINPEASGPGGQPLRELVDRMKKEARGSTN